MKNEECWPDAGTAVAFPGILHSSFCILHSPADDRHPEGTSKQLGGGAISDDEGTVLADPAGGNCRVAVAQAQEHGGFLCASYYPQDAAGTIESRVRQCHPAPSLVWLCHGDAGPGDMQHRVTGHQGGGVTVGTEAQVDIALADGSQLRMRGRALDAGAIVTAFMRRS